MLKMLGKNISYIALSDAGSRLLNLLINIYLARVLAPEGFGLIVLGTTVLTYAIWVADLGLMTLGTREIARGQNNFQATDIVFLKTSLALLVCLTAFALIPLFNLRADLEIVIQFYLFYLLVDAILLEWYFKGIEKYVWLPVYRWTSGILFLAGCYLRIQSIADVSEVPLLYVAAHLLAALLLWPGMRQADRQWPSLNIGKYRRLLGEAVQIGFGSIFAQVILVVPPLALAYVTSPEEVGIFGAAMKIVMLGLAIDRIFGALFLPRIAAWWAADSHAVPQRLSLLVKLVIPIGAGIVLALSTFAEPLVDLFFGADYAKAGRVLFILSWIGASALINSVFTLTLIATSNERIYFISMLFGSIIATGMILAGSFIAGLTGTAIGTVLGETVIVSIVAIAFRQQFRINIFRPLLLSLLSAALVGFVCHQLLPLPLYVLPLVLAAYILVIFISRQLTLQDLRAILKR